MIMLLISSDLPHLMDRIEQPLVLTLRQVPGDLPDGQDHEAGRSGGCSALQVSGSFGQVSYGNHGWSFLTGAISHVLCGRNDPAGPQK